MMMLLYILVGLQLLSGVSLITLVLIHSPKGDGIAGIGGSAQLFSSPRGAEEGLNKITLYVLYAFFILSFITGYYGHHMMAAG
jgi:preprotein translocase subunit SecG